MDSISETDRCDDSKAPVFNVITTSVIMQMGVAKEAQPEEVHLEIENPSQQEQYDDELNPQLEEFQSDTQYFLCTMGYFVGFGNILRFPYVVATNGGAAFLIPYFLSLFLVIVPFFAVETSWGQLIRIRQQYKFSVIHPVLWGVSFAILWVNCWTIPYYTTLFAYVLSFLFNSFSNPLPWQKDTGDESLWNTEYFPEEVLERTEHIGEDGRLVPWLCFMLVLTYVGLYFIMRKGIQSSSQFAYGTATLPYFILSILLLKGITLPGSEKGLKYLLVPEWSRLLEIKIWKSALLQTVYSSGLTFGGLMFYASARKKDAKLTTQALFLPLSNGLTSFFASLTLYTFIGHVSEKLQIDIQELAKGGYTLAFVAYPGLMTTLNMPNLWSVFFFAMLLLVGIDSVFGMHDYVIGFLWDLISYLRQKTKKEIFVIGEMLVCFILGLQFVTTNGWWWFNLFNWYAAGDCLFFLLVAEMLIFNVYFGLDNLDAIIYARTGERFPKAFKFILKYFSTPVVTAAFVYSMYVEIHFVMTPRWTHWFGRFFLVAPMVICCLGFFKRRQSPEIEKLVVAQIGKTMEELRMDILKADGLKEEEMEDQKYNNKY